MDVILLKMAFHTTVYTTWQERNSRGHQGVWLTTETMIRRTDKAIRNMICSLKYKGTHKLEVCFVDGLRCIRDDILIRLLHCCTCVCIRTSI
ncbi:hypothetical protein Bca101_077653 [Brassica carinata]